MSKLSTPYCVHKNWLKIAVSSTVVVIQSLLVLGVNRYLCLDFLSLENGRVNVTGSDLNIVQAGRWRHHRSPGSLKLFGETRVATRTPAPNNAYDPGAQ